jgi:hypothetical protein
VAHPQPDDHRPFNDCHRASGIRLIVADRIDPLWKNAEDYSDVVAIAFSNSLVAATLRRRTQRARHPASTGYTVDKPARRRPIWLASTGSRRLGDLILDTGSHLHRAVRATGHSSLHIVRAHERAFAIVATCSTALPIL